MAMRTRSAALIVQAIACGSRLRASGSPWSRLNRCFAEMVSSVSGRATVPGATSAPAGLATIGAIVLSLSLDQERLSVSSSSRKF